MFNKCFKLKEIKGIEYFNTNNVINMNSMFQCCNELEYLNLSNFNTSNVTDMGWMFNKCSKLKEIKGIDKFITNKVINMERMFNDCNELEYLNLTGFDISNVTNMGYMFNKCYKLKEIKGIEKLISKGTINTEKKSQNDDELEDLYIIDFYVSNLINKECMFNECNLLKGIDKYRK